MSKFCNKCNNEMINLGNIDSSVFCTYPASWNETYVCHLCKTKKIVLVRGTQIPIQNINIEDYTDITKSIFEDDPDFEYFEETKSWRRIKATKEQDDENNT